MSENTSHQNEPNHSNHSKVRLGVFVVAGLLVLGCALFLIFGGNGVPRIATQDLGYFRFKSDGDEWPVGYYLPPSEGFESKDVGTRVRFPKLRGFALRRVSESNLIEKVDRSEIEANIIENRVGFDGWDCVFLKSISSKANRPYSTANGEPVIWCKDGTHAILRVTPDRLIRINLGSWNVLNAVSIPSSSVMASCEAGAVILSSPCDWTRAASRWTAATHDESARLTVLTDQMKVVGTCELLAWRMFADRSSPFVFLQDPVTKRTQVVNTENLEAIDSFELDKREYPEVVSYREIASQWKHMPDTHKVERFFIADQNVQKQPIEGRDVCFSDDGSKLLRYRQDVNQVALCDWNAPNSLNHVIFESRSPLSIGMHLDTRTCYLASGHANHNKVVVSRGLTTTEINLAGTTISRISTHPGGRGAFAISTQNKFHWLEPTTDAPSKWGFEMEAESPSRLPPFTLVTDEEPLKLKSMAVRSTTTEAQELKGVSYWMQWDLDGQHCYLLNTRRQIICFDVQNNREVARLSLGEWRTSQFFELTKAGILIHYQQELAMIERKTLKPRWVIDKKEHTHWWFDSHPTHDYIVSMYKNAITLFDPKTGKIAGRGERSDIGTLTDGNVRIRRKSPSASTFIVDASPYPDNSLYHPEKNFYKVEQSKTLMMRGEEDRDYRRIPLWMPRHIRNYAVHPTNPLVVLVNGEQNNTLLIKPKQTE